VSQEFCHNYTPSKIDKSKAYGMEQTFSSQLKNQVHNYNTNPHAGAHNSSVVALNAKVEDLKNVMGDNMSVLLKRGERVDTLLDQADDLEQQTKVFKKTVKAARQEVQAKHNKSSTILYSIYTALFIVASLFIWAIFERIRGSKSNNNSN
jgi:outer membrane murein-binding lipoprotein Lpp